MFSKTFHVILSNAKNLAVYLAKSLRGILPIVRMTLKVGQTSIYSSFIYSTYASNHK